MRFFPEDVVSKMDKLLFILACKNEGASKTNSVVDLIQRLALGGVFLKTFGIDMYWVLILVGILYVNWEIFFGRWLIAKHVIVREGSMNNKLKNPELMKLLDKNGKDS